MVLPPLTSKRSNTLEKRPTFESLDKRKSWSVVDSHHAGSLLGSSSVPSVAPGSGKWSQKAKGQGSNPAKGPELAKTSKG